MARVRPARPRSSGSPRSHPIASRVASSPTPAVAATRLRASRTSPSRRVPRDAVRTEDRTCGVVSSATHRHSSRTLAPTSGAIAAPTPGPGSAQRRADRDRRARHQSHEQRHLRPSAQAAHEVAIVLVEDLDGAS